MTSDDRWEAELDRVEVDLRAIEEAIERGSTPVALRAFETPALPEPMPVALLPRATRLLERSRRVESSVAASLARVRGMMADADDERRSRLLDTAL